ncbi:MAG: hypothetical protein ACI392_02785 [Paludibacteraceae bacterium]
MSRVVVTLEIGRAAPTAVRFAETIAAALKHDVRTLNVGGDTVRNASKLADLLDELERLDASMLVMEVDGARQINTCLQACRTLRIPYLLVRPNQTPHFDTVAVPVTFLPEDKEKAPFAAAFGRFFAAKLTIFKPKDYGTRALKNIDAMTTLFDSFQLQYDIVQARKGSDGVEREAARWAQTQADLVIVSASREYGLDDILFGCKEYKIAKQCNVPLLLINPRGDLYALCD